MSVASLGTTTSTALNQAQSLLRSQHDQKTAQTTGADMLAQITAQLTGQGTSSGAAPTGGSSGGFSSLGQLGTDVLSMLGIGGGATSSPANAASAYATSQGSI